MTKPIASVSLDLDNKWSYMKTHGDAGWEALPSYLSIVVPRVLELLAKRSMRITWFIVGLDAEQAADRQVLAEIPRAGHEVGNHSFHHEPWLHLYTEDEIDRELARAEAAIEATTGVRPTGFRGPGFSLSPAVLRVLVRRGYRYDCSTFPTYLGPLARAYYFATARGLSREEMRQRQKLFGKFADGWRPLRPYRWRTEAGPILEIPVTTMPLARVPIHLSYILYLASFSRLAARLYWQAALRMCKGTRTELSLLLHPLDFLGEDDVQGLEFFPGMRLPGAQKVALAGQLLDQLSRHFQPVAMEDHFGAVSVRERLPIRRADVLL